MSLRDEFGRVTDYLRISVTDRCDLRCAYCMPVGFKEYATPANWLTFPEIARLVSVFAQQGLRRVRLTGGEPLLRTGLPELVSAIAGTDGIEDVSLSTNGTQLHKHGAALRKAGLTRLNVSLDTLDRERFANIARRDGLPDVLRGLDQVAALGFTSTKINMVWLPDTVRADLVQMIDYCRERGFVLRLIENMPMGEAARRLGTSSLQPLINELRETFGLIDGAVAGGGPARYLVSPDGKFSLGFITPLSQHFCTTCNRVRMTVDGALQLCLGQDHSLDFRSLIRAGATDAELATALLRAVANKPERHDFVERPAKLLRPMSRTGG